MIKKILIFTAIAMLSATSLMAITKEDVYEQLKGKFKNMEAISFEFYSPDSNVEGMLIARKGGKFKMKYGSQLIISDSKTIWNHQVEDNSVLISSTESMGSSPSVEAFFFEFVDKYKPQSLSRVNGSSDDTAYKFDLKKSSDSEMISLENVTLLLDDKLNIKSVIFDSGAMKTKWLISSLKLNPKLDKSTFTFSPPPDADVIDMR